MTNFYKSFALIHIPVSKFSSKHKDWQVDSVCNVLYAKLCCVNLQLYIKHFIVQLMHTNYKILRLLK